MSGFSVDPIKQIKTFVYDKTIFGILLYLKSLGLQYTTVMCPF